MHFYCHVDTSVLVKITPVAGIINDYYNLHVKTKKRNHKFYLYLNVENNYGIIKKSISEKIHAHDKDARNFIWLRIYKIYTR